MIRNLTQFTPIIACVCLAVLIFSLVPVANSERVDNSRFQGMINVILDRIFDEGYSQGYADGYLDGYQESSPDNSSDSCSDNSSDSSSDSCSDWCYADGYQNGYQQCSDDSPNTGGGMNAGTDKLSYVLGDTITINGSVDVVSEESVVTLSINNPDGIFVAIDQAKVNPNDGYYEFFVVTGNTFKTSGEYEYTVVYYSASITSNFNLE